MRHRKKNCSSFGLKSGPRKALMRGLLRALVEHERIKTTLPRAKALRPLAEKAITLGKRGRENNSLLAARRLILSKYPFKKTAAKIMDDLSLRFKSRPGGYTRIVKLGNRQGDQAPKALIEFVDFKCAPPPTKEEKEKRKASKEYKKERRLSAKKTNKKRKTLRKIQAESRRRNRI